MIIIIIIIIIIITIISNCSCNIVKSTSFRVDKEIKEPSVNLENNTKSLKNLDRIRKLEKTSHRDNKNTEKKIQIE